MKNKVLPEVVVKSVTIHTLKSSRARISIQFAGLTFIVAIMQGVEPSKEDDLWVAWPSARGRGGKIYRLLWADETTSAAIESAALVAYDNKLTEIFVDSINKRTKSDELNKQ